MSPFIEWDYPAIISILNECDNVSDRVQILKKIYYNIECDEHYFFYIRCYLKCNCPPEAPIDKYFLVDRVVDVLSYFFAGNFFYHCGDLLRMIFKHCDDKKNMARFLLFETTECKFTIVNNLCEYDVFFESEESINVFLEASYHLNYATYQRLSNYFTDDKIIEMTREKMWIFNTEAKYLDGQMVHFIDNFINPHHSNALDDVISMCANPCVIDFLINKFTNKNIVTVEDNINKVKFIVHLSDIIHEIKTSRASKKSINILIENGLMHKLSVSSNLLKLLDEMHLYQCIINNEIELFSNDMLYEHLYSEIELVKTMTRIKDVCRSVGRRIIIRGGDDFGKVHMTHLSELLNDSMFIKNYCLIHPDGVNVKKDGTVTYFGNVLTLVTKN